MKPGMFKTAAFLMPAVFTLVLLAAFGPAMGAAARRALRRADVTTAVGAHQFKMPDAEWADRVSRFVNTFTAELLRYDRASKVPTMTIGFQPVNDLTFWAADDDAYRALKPPAQRAKHADGYYDRSQGLIVIRRPAHPDLAAEPLSRELTLALLEKSQPDAEWSAWFAEGVALYFAGPSPNFGGRRTDRLAEAAAGRAAGSLEKLLRATPADFTDPALAARAYSLVHFLAHHETCAAKFDEYLREERKPGAVGSGRFGDIFGPDVEREWLEYR